MAHGSLSSVLGKMCVQYLCLKNNLNASIRCASLVVHVCMSVLLLSALDVIDVLYYYVVDSF